MGCRFIVIETLVSLNCYETKPVNGLETNLAKAFDFRTPPTWEKGHCRLLACRGKPLTFVVGLSTLREQEFKSILVMLT